MIPHLVCYVGAGLSGRSTSLLSVMRSQGPATEVSPGVDYFFDGLRLRLSLFRGKYWYDDPNSPTLNSSIRAEIVDVQNSDAFIFIVDSRDFRVDASSEALEQLRSDLHAVGRELDECPVVFQFNRRDDLRAVSPGLLRERFQSKCGLQIETVATRDEGTVAAIRALQGLLSRVL